MIHSIGYTARAVRMYKKLNPELLPEVREALKLLADSENHSKLKVHPLSGKLTGLHSARVNYSHRLVFEFQNDGSIIVVGIGSHDIYN